MNNLVSVLPSFKQFYFLLALVTSKTTIEQQHLKDIQSVKKFKEWLKLHLLSWIMYKYLC